MQRVNLSEHAHYATPGINFDWSVAKGHPFAYHVYGTAIVGVTVDCLRGIYEIDYVKCCHDFGSSMNTSVDNGQIEGGIVQGIGWMTMEEIFYDESANFARTRFRPIKFPTFIPSRKLLILSRLKLKEKTSLFSIQKQSANRL